MSAGSGEPSAPVLGPMVFRHDRADGFGRYHDLVGTTGAASARVGEGFEATVAARNASGIMLFDRQVAGVEHRREPAHIRRDNFDHFYLQVLRSGRLMAGAPDGERWLAPGDAVLMDATRPQRTVVVAADYVTVVLARPLVEAAAPEARRLHGLCIPRGASGGLGEAVLSLVRRGQGLDADAAAGAGTAVAGLLGEIAREAFTGRAGARDDGARTDAERSAADRLRVGLFIDANIGRPDLDVGAVAAGLGMSRSGLYRAFASAGGVEREITRRRVARFRSILMRPGEGRSTERLALDLGFSSPSHSSRLFKATYGLTPGACRAGSHAVQGPRGSGPGLDQLRDWYGALGAQISEA